MLEAQPEWANQVFAVDGFSLEDVEGLMEASVDAGAEVLNYEVPLFSAIVLAGHGLRGWWPR